MSEAGSAKQVGFLPDASAIKSNADAARQTDNVPPASIAESKAKPSEQIQIPSACLVTKTDTEEKAKIRAEVFHTVAGFARGLTSKSKQHEMLDAWIAKFNSANA